MSLRVGTNMSSLVAQRSLNESQRNIDKSFAQLASGSRITKSADDAAGLSLSENLKSQIRGYRQAGRNAQDGISLVQTAEGGLGEISNILTRLKELGVQASTDSIGDRERGFLNVEVQQLTKEIDRIAGSARFGTTNLLDGTGGKFDFQVGIYNNESQDRISFDSGSINATTGALAVEGLDYSQRDTAREALSTVEEAQRKVNEFRANLGASQNRLISAGDYLGVVVENLSAANSRIRDTDVAESTADLTKNNILLSASTSVLQQANQNPMGALKLLQ